MSSGKPSHVPHVRHLPHTRHVYIIFVMNLMSLMSFLFLMLHMFNMTSPREEKSDLEMDYKARLREMDEKHQHELQELEAIYQQKIMGEVERYQVLKVSC